MGTNFLAQHETAKHEPKYIRPITVSYSCTSHYLSYKLTSMDHRSVTSATC